MNKYVSVVALSLMVALAGSALADTLKVDPAHSSIVFKIGHMNVAHVYGRFNDPSGTIEYDPAAREKARFDVQVQARNVDTAVEARDEHLRTPDFFDAEKHPTISFKSSSVKPDGEGAMEVAGDITLMGVTKPITIKLRNTGSATDPEGKARVGFETEFTINRTEFGMKSLPGIADEVLMMIAIEAIKQ